MSNSSGLIFRTFRDTGFALQTGDAKGNGESGRDSTGSADFVGSAEATTAGQVVSVT
jgi:hypothetical protein